MDKKLKNWGTVRECRESVLGSHGIESKQRERGAAREDDERDAGVQTRLLCSRSIGTDTVLLPAYIKVIQNSLTTNVDATVLLCRDGTISCQKALRRHVAYEEATPKREPMQPDHEALNRSYPAVTTYSVRYLCCSWSAQMERTSACDPASLRYPKAPALPRQPTQTFRIENAILHTTERSKIPPEHSGTPTPYHTT